MVKAAQKTIEELGLTAALNHRYAHLADVSVNDVLFADRSAKSHMKEGGLFEGIAKKTVAPKSLDKVETMPIAKFLKDVLPNVDAVDVMFENKHVGNLVSLVAPVDKTAPLMFKWNNGFSWSYGGDVADSLTERVKQAGGSVTGD